MFVEIPHQQILMILGAFLIGWILSSINSRLADRQRARKRDPRDDRIRALEAEHRIAQSDANSLRDTVVKLKSEIDEIAEGVEKRDNVITHQQERMEELKRDLKESVLKTRELRHELSDRAAESVHAEAKQRELETELSVAQASSDMIATGVLDYSLAPGNDDAEPKDAGENAGEPDVSKAAT